MIEQLSVGNKCYAKKVSIHINGNEFEYSAPRGKKFALILMNEERPDNEDGIACDQFLNDCGWVQTK